MSRKAAAAVLLIGGAVLCLPGILIAAFFASFVADRNGLRAAPVCATPTRDTSATCVSYVNGIATAWTYRSKSLDRVTIALADTTVDVGYGCDISPAGACNGITFRAGDPLATAWWKGQVVAIGPAESSPQVITDNNPEYRLREIAFFLTFAIPGVSLVIAGLLLLQAPMSVTDLIMWALKDWPDPPRPVQRSTIWRVALGYWTWGAYFAWGFSYFFLSILLMVGSQYDLVPWLFVALLFISLAATSLIAPPLLSRLVRTSARRTVTVRHTKEVQVKGGTNTRVAYDLLDGSLATTTLDTSWHGHIYPGDHLDVLADPRSGRVRRVLTVPSSLGVGRDASSGAGLGEAAVARS